MRIGVMQPYFMPYIGYWQLINAVDKFVILDDVNYIMRGYINRNSILLNGGSYRFTIPIEKASQNKLIKETKLSFTEDEKKNLKKTIRFAYNKAPQYKKVMPLINDIINNPETDLTSFIKYSIEKVIEYLGIYKEGGVLVSSNIDKDQSLKGEERIIEICKKLNGDTYINPCGGRKLYTSKKFKEQGIDLYFLDVKFEKLLYKQYENPYVPCLSIIDVMMFNSVDTIRKVFLDQFELNK